MFKPSKANAEVLYDTLNHPTRKRAPNGWKTLGEGAYRAAYLHKDSNVVYKLGDKEVNEAEVARINMIRTNSRTGFINTDFGKVYIPRAKAYKLRPKKSKVKNKHGKTCSYVGDMSVIAMERGYGTHTNCDYDWNDPDFCNCDGMKTIGMCYKDLHERLNRTLGMVDMHGENVLIDRKTKKITVIDLGEDYS